MDEGRKVAEWATYGGAVSVVLSCHYEGRTAIGGDPFSGNIPAYNAAEYTRKNGLRGERVFSALNDAAAIALIEERIAEGYYTPTGSRHAPGRVVVEQRA